MTYSHRFSVLWQCCKTAARNASSVALFVRCGILGLALNLVGWAHTCRADEFDVLREKWVEMLTGGSHLDLTDPAVTSSISRLSSLAHSYLSALQQTPNGPLSLP